MRIDFFRNETLDDARQRIVLALEHKDGSNGYFIAMSRRSPRQVIHSEDETPFAIACPEGRTVDLEKDRRKAFVELFQTLLGTFKPTFTKTCFQKQVEFLQEDITPWESVSWQARRKKC